MVVPNLRALMGLAIGGAGITVLPRYYCEAELQRGELLELIQPRNPPFNHLYLAYSAKHSTAAQSGGTRYPAKSQGQMVDLRYKFSYM